MSLDADNHCPFCSQRVMHSGLMQQHLLECSDGRKKAMLEGRAEKSGGRVEFKQSLHPEGGAVYSVACFGRSGKRIYGASIWVMKGSAVADSINEELAGMALDYGGGKRAKSR